MDRTESLPDDALAHILGHLQPRDLAATRCVRKAWCAIVDGRRLLLRKILPHAVRGLFFNYGNRASSRPRFFASPSSTRIDSDLSFLPSHGGGSTELVDHCGGLLLYRDLRTLCVINPATRRWEDLPWEDDGCDAYLVFDPAESLHYQVFSVPRELEKIVLNKHDELEEDLIKCPPFIWTINVFSSSTKQWEKRSFVCETEAPEKMTDARLDLLDPLSISWSRQRGSRSVYWRGSLYVHFYGVFVVRHFCRLSLSNGKYRVIKTPINDEESIHMQSYVGKSENGVYFATVHDGCRLQVWTLMESSEHVVWVSKKYIDLAIATLPFCQSDYVEGIGKTWILDHDDDVSGNIRMENLDWDSDDDNIVNIEDSSCQYARTSVSFLGFHPYKEVFLALVSYKLPVALAYHLSSSKFQYLGRPQLVHYSRNACIQGSFPYTPCMTGHLLNRFRE